LDQSKVLFHRWMLSTTEGMRGSSDGAFSRPDTGAL